jgi:hypothetical protein
MNCPECYENGEYKHNTLNEVGPYLFQCPSCNTHYSLVRTDPNG